ncbi:ABC transporter ATP-binding protein [Nocardioides korecus]
MHRTPAVRARGITVHHGDVVALDRVDLEVAAGGVHGLVGPNGAGKTTLLSLLLGVSTARSGSLEVLGQRCGTGTARGWGRGVPDGVAGFVDGPGLYPALTARANLEAVDALRGVAGRERRRGRAARVVAALEEVGLGEVADARVGGFSLGMRQRLGLAAALLTRPRLLVLDEPANGLDPAGTRQVDALLRGLTADGVAVVLSSHRMDDLAALCTDVTLLSTGRVAFSGPVERLASLGRDVDHRLSTTDPVRARRLAARTRGLEVLDGPGDALVLRGAAAARDVLVARLVDAGIAVRELTPVVPPLEAAFLTLTGGPGTEGLGGPAGAAPGPTGPDGRDAA